MLHVIPFVCEGLTSVPQALGEEHQGILTASGSPSSEGLREICRILVVLSFVVLVIRCARVITSILELVRGTRGPERSNEGFNHSLDGIAVIFYSYIAHMTSE